MIDSKKSGTTLKSGGVLRCQMPGAGGYGNPLERDRALTVSYTQLDVYKRQL